MPCGVCSHAPLSRGTSWTLMKEPGCPDQTATLLRLCPCSGRPLSPDSHSNPHPGPSRAHGIQTQEVGGFQTCPVYDEELEIQTTKHLRDVAFTSARAWHLSS